MPSFRSFALVLATASLAFSHPIHEHHARDLKIIGTTFSSLARRQTAPGSELQLLVDGNDVFRGKTDPELMKKLTDEGQAPPFMFLGCSDSRVGEGTVFDAKPGTLFTERNIANQFLSSDTNSESVLAYGVGVLGVKHVIVMGHYGCGGVAAAIASRPTSNIDAGSGVVQNWIEPIRQMYEASSRPEIVALREKNKDLPVVEEPEIDEPGFRALVEENVKASVGRIAQSSVMSNHYALLASGGGAPAERRAEGGPPGDVFVHGWVYDIANGEIRDLGVSVGPPGKPIPQVPFAQVVSAAEKTAATPEAPQKRCEDMCKTKRNFVPL